jgi:hypothetical protein
MTKSLTRLGAILGFILLVAIIALARPATAQQQPNLVNPSARVETEQQLLNLTESESRRRGAIRLW